jgi:hypothetical protein
MNSQNQNIFPIQRTPPILQDAINEIVNATKFSPALVASSILAAVAAACQNSIDVQLPLGQVIPTSLYLLLIANSGEGKTATDQLVGKPIRTFDEKEKVRFELEAQKLKSSKKVWDIELKAIEKTIQKIITQRISTDNTQELEELNVEIEKLNQKLQDHHINEPKMPKRYKLIHNDITPAKIARALHENIASMFLSSDEGSSFLKGQVTKDLGFLNQVWDGSPFSVERMGSPSFEVNDARVSIFIGIQSEPFFEYLQNRGKHAREIGFFARVLCSYPESTMGTRFVANEKQSLPKLEALCARISEILMQDRLEIDAGRTTRKVLTFSYEAKEIWINVRNNVEAQLRPDGSLSDVKDAASKFASNVARVAALFHRIEGETGDISDETVTQAGFVCTYYLDEFIRLFSKKEQIQSVEADSWDLDHSIQKYFTNHPNESFMKQSALAQYGPSYLRKDRPRLDAAINMLQQRGIIHIVKDIKKTTWFSYNSQQSQYLKVTTTRWQD